MVIGLRKPAEIHTHKKQNTCCSFAPGGGGPHPQLWTPKLEKCVETCFFSPKFELVGGFNPSEKYYIVSWDDYSQYTEK